MAVTESSGYFLFDNVKDTFPQSTSLTGTIDAVGVGVQIIGTGTLFTSELQRGEYIYIAAQNAFRKIRSIVSDTELYLEEAFPTATFAGATPRRTPAQRYRSLSWAIDAAGTAKINGLVFPASTTDTREVKRNKRPEAILIDTTPNGNIVYVDAQI